jgi:hypothetical protein
MFMPKVSCSCGLLVEVVQHHLGQFAALELDHQPHARTCRSRRGCRADALDLLLVTQLGDALLQRLLVDLVGSLVDDDRAALAAVDLLEVALARMTTRPRPVR